MQGTSFNSRHSKIYLFFLYFKPHNIGFDFSYKLFSNKLICRICQTTFWQKIEKYWKSDFAQGVLKVRSVIQLSFIFSFRIDNQPVAVGQYAIYYLKKSKQNKNTTK